MIGDSYEDDIEGARALGMKAFLLDRDGRRLDEPDRLPDLFALPRRARSSSPLSPRSVAASRRWARRRCQVSRMRSEASLFV